MTTTDKIHQTLRDSAGMRWLVLLLLAFAMFCSYIFMDILSPIKDLMQSTRGWDSTAFGTMQGSETFLNVFVFFLIFAGIILDKMGVRFTAILSGAVMLVGATINWYAVTDAFQGSGLQTWFTNNLNYIPGFDELGISPFYRGMPASAKFAAIGFMIFGCGVEMAGITVSRGIVKWFKGREMALAMGSEMALARLGVATCMIFSPVFAKLGGVIDVSRSVAFGVVLLLIALIMFIVYFFMDKKLDEQTKLTSSGIGGSKAGGSPNKAPASGAKSSSRIETGGGSEDGMPTIDQPKVVAKEATAAGRPNKATHATKDNLSTVVDAGWDLDFDGLLASLNP